MREGEVWVDCRAAEDQYEKAKKRIKGLAKLLADAEFGPGPLGRIRGGKEKKRFTRMQRGSVATFAKTIGIPTEKVLAAGTGEAPPDEEEKGPSAADVLKRKGLRLDHHTLITEIKSGNADSVRWLLKGGLSPNRQIDEIDGMTPLELAVSLVDLPPSPAVPTASLRVEVIQAILMAGEKPRGSNMVVHSALNERRTNRLTALLQAGVPIDARDREGRSLVACAMRMDHSSLEQEPSWTELLVAEGQPAAEPTMAWVLLWSAAMGKRRIVELLLRKGIQVDARGLTVVCPMKISTIKSCRIGGLGVLRCISP